MGSSGVTQPEDQVPASFNCLLFVFRYLFCVGAILDAQVRASEILKEHSEKIDWVYVRPDTLENGKAEGCEIETGYMGPDFELRPIKRSDVARFMASQIYTDDLVHTAKIIRPKRG